MEECQANVGKADSDGVAEAAAKFVDTTNAYNTAQRKADKEKLSTALKKRRPKGTTSNGKAKVKVGGKTQG